MPETALYSTTLTTQSLMRGGIFYSLQRRLRLINENDTRVVIRAVIFAVVTWIPLLVLAVLEHASLVNETSRLLVADIPLYVRFLLVMPILIIAENVIDDRYVLVTSYFLNSGILPNDKREQYMEMLGSTCQRATSVMVEVVLIGVAVMLAVTAAYTNPFNNAPAWARTSDGGFSLAGAWYFFLSFPLFLFLLLRWGWRFIIWCSMLVKLSKLKLQLVPTHPDRTGGLGILAASFPAFSPILFALSSLLAANWAMRIIHENLNVREFEKPFIAYFAIALAVPTVPLLIFCGRLIRLKLRGLHDYGVLANYHSIFFDRKWIESGQQNLPDVLGTPDISSLCDIVTDYSLIQDMRYIPFRLKDVIVLAVSICAPMLPLLLLQIPLNELIMTLANALL